MFHQTRCAKFFIKAKYSASRVTVEGMLPRLFLQQHGTCMRPLSVTCEIIRMFYITDLNKVTCRKHCNVDVTFPRLLNSKKSSRLLLMRSFLV